MTDKYDIQSRMSGYNIDDLYFRVNDIYSQFDNDELHIQDAIEQLRFACEAYLYFNKAEDE